MPLAALPLSTEHAASAAEIELGRELFFDPVLSATKATSCATCHQPQLGWADGRETGLGFARSVIWRDLFFANDAIHHALMYHPLVYWPVFLMGMLTFRCLDSIPGNRIVSPLHMGALSVMAMGLIALLSYWADEYWNYSIHVGMLAPLYGALIYSLREPRNWIARLLSVRWLHYLGEASYSVYILQLPVYGLWLYAGLVPASEGWLFYLYLTSLLAVSSMLFRWFETPLRRWARRSFSHG